MRGWSICRHAMGGVCGLTITGRLKRRRGKSSWRYGETESTSFASLRLAEFGRADDAALHTDGAVVRRRWAVGGKKRVDGCVFGGGLLTSCWLNDYSSRLSP